MTTFNLYLSGVLIGRVAFHGDGRADITTRDLYTGLWGEDTSLLQQMAFDVGTITAHFSEYAGLLASAKDGDEVRASWGDVYERQGDALFFRHKKRGVDVHFADGQPFLFIAPTIISSVLLVREGMENRTVLAEEARYDLPRDAHLIEDYGTFMVPMRDGVKLATHVWLPKGAARPLKTVFARTPYHARRYLTSHMPLVCRGYAVVIQDVRGREKSEGDFFILQGEIHDGSDSLDWIAAQEWSDGDVGMIGGSYGGFVQWEAAASGNKHLKCMFSMVTGGPPFVDLPRPGGALIAGLLPWMNMMSTRSLEGPDIAEKMRRDDWDEIIKVRPLSAIPQRAFGSENPSWTRWLENETDGPVWKESDWTAQGPITTPAFVQSGWFDDDHQGTMRAWDIARHYPKRDRFLLLGPWTHGSNTVRDVGAVRLKNHALRYDPYIYALRWFETHLNGRDMGLDAQPGVLYYMLGAEEWRESTAFPPEDFAQTDLYFAPDGRLSRERPTEQGAAAYTYDPADPAPHLIDLSENEFAVPGDYATLEKRPDFVCFTLPLTGDVELAGDVTATFYASSSARDTDWIVRITDVDQAGRSVQRCYGVFRARFKGGFDRVDLLTPGKPEKYTLRLGQFAARFARGHSLRVHITSSATGLVIPNLNTGLPIKDEVEPVVARQEILFGGQYPSKITVHMKDV